MHVDLWRRSEISDFSCLKTFFFYCSFYYDEKPIIKTGCHEHCLSHTIMGEFFYKALPIINFYGVIMMMDAIRDSNEIN